MMNGTLIGNRYEIVETIGTGGMAIVYKAKCLILNRYVALKVLRPEFREDKEFLARFKAEAQSAGSLSHPNIVSIYDVGQEDDLDYIVMEYVEGVTLKQYIEAKGVIPWREAVDYAGQICSGLDHAHKKGIIHKDIKPHNILITREGTLKITDFGIAKVISSSTITTGNATMGSVHYFSPEQARGGYMDYKTDIYSLGVVLYEMVTGKLPFQGDSAIAIAMQHIEKEAESPSVLNPEVPKSLENVIDRAMRKEQALRYDSVVQMMVDLKKVYLGGAVDYSDLTMGATTVTPVVKENGPEGNKEEKRQGSQREREMNMPEELFIARGKEPGKKKDILPIISGILVGLVLVVGGFFLGNYLLNNVGSSKIEVPDLVGKTIEEAENLLENSNIEIVIEKEEKSDKIEKDKIISQSPAAGKMVKDDSEIKVVISLGMGEFPMPDLVNYKDIEAENILREKDLMFKIVHEPSTIIPKGYVVRQIPDAGVYIDGATSVTLYVSAGTIEVPKLTGMTLEEAKLAIEDAGLIVGQIVDASSAKEKGTVIGQSIPAGTKMAEETTVDLKVSSGPAKPSEAPSTAPSTAPSATPSTAPTQAPTRTPAPITVISPNAG